VLHKLKTVFVLGRNGSVDVQSSGLSTATGVLWVICEWWVTARASSGNK
jgi:hypothetical protein